ncbi:helix-turn-helix transcriptional regulator [Frigidibacter sp. ROC022]|uniref:helix-turn-helix transcriptional regulator n=1 Tax=Frigidibacter sp. ROC022 TaxID=2971796 RepID=UPI00215B3350|nr:LuxR family transcriptional regulator [Frigidibacter sp. ROC022]MCR8725272.1 LuxR family transcriptional regulator [Frigidibacter sp. ROC022]
MQKTTAQGQRFFELAPAGHYLALRVGFAFPMEERIELPPAWIAEYTRGGLMLMDPVMKWVYQHQGAQRWSELALPDPANVLAAAARHGLCFGAAVAVNDHDLKGQRSFGSFARSDREFSDAELDELLAEVERLHQAKAPPTNLTKAELEALRMVKDGLLMKEIAGLLGVSEGAVQQRLKNAKTKLNATTSSHAVSMASGFGLI